MRLFRSLPAAALTAVVALIGTAAPQQARADDTDLYLSPNTGIGGEPLVMFSLDFRSDLGSTICTNAALTTCAEANYFRSNAYTLAQITALGTGKLYYYDVLRLSLRIVFNEFTGFKGGLMMSHDNATNCAGIQSASNKCSNGGYIQLGFTEMDSTGRNTFLNILDNIPVPSGNLSHSYQGAELFFELYRYIKGFKVWNAYNGWTDFGTTSTKNVGQSGDTAGVRSVQTPGWDSNIIQTVSGTDYYKTPFSSGDICTKLFTVNFLFQVSNQDNDSNTEIAKTVANQGMGFTPSNSNAFKDVISYMHNTDLKNSINGVQSVTSYFVSTNNNVTTQGYAAAGGTSVVALTSNPATLVASLENILREILSTSTTFVSASVPVNVFNRAESLDNVFIALFQVDANAKPVWPGNVKKLKLKTTTVSGVTSISLVDANGTAAIGNDGRVAYSALTFWTDASKLPAANVANNEVAGADGRSVARGAAGMKIPSFTADAAPTLNSTTSARHIYYPPASFTNGTATSLSDLNADTTTSTALMTQFGAATATEALGYINWARGADPTDTDVDASLTDTRAWIMGDPLHSRPLPVNYGLINGHTDETNPLIYIAVGANDGMLHFFRNTLPGDVTNPAVTDTPSGGGKEEWAFMPRETMGIIKTLYNNSSASTHPYGIDGAPASYTVDANQNGSIDSGDKVYLYFGLRLGGRTLYALDITDPTTPKILWKIDNTTTGFSELGYTFAQPHIGTINTGSGNTAALFIGGGYSKNKDTRDVVGSDDSYGNALYVINALTGALIWKATKGATTGVVSSTEYDHVNMTDSVPMDLAVVDSDGDGLVDRVLFGDTGGQVWRADVKGATSDWRVTRLANLGRHDTSTTTADRRFFHRPDFVPAKDTNGSFDGVVIGSGDRQNPLDRSGNSLKSGVTVNYMYVIKDRKTSAYVAADAQPTVLTSTDLGDVTSNCLQTSSCGGSVPDTSKGWKLQLQVGPGEKSLSSPLTVTNTVFFTTYLPLGATADITAQSDGEEAATCGPQEGKGLLYAVNLTDATFSKNFNVARDGGTASTNTSRYAQLASAGIPAEVVGVSLGGQAYVLPPDLKPSAIESSTRWRTFWYEVEDTTN